jgi:hypothetical protein
MKNRETRFQNVPRFLWHGEARHGFKLSEI